MTSLHIVAAHPAPDSFTLAWAQASARGAQALGWQSSFSDLYRLGFDPAEQAAFYGENAAGFDVLKAQEAASREGRLPPVVQAEAERLRGADALILHFPLWWFAPPAMVKGWCERVLAHGAMHDVDNRFDTGRFKGKRVLFCVSTGSRAEESAPDGKEGNVQMLLWPLAYTFRYLGFDVCVPQVIHGVHGYNKADRRTAMETRLRETLAAQTALIEGIFRRPLLAFNPDSDFTAEGRLKPGAPSYTPFITTRGGAD